MSPTTTDTEPSLQYLQYILSFKIWKNVSGKEHYPRINKIATIKLKPPPGLREKFKKRDFFYFLPSSINYEEDRLTRFLLVMPINVAEKAQQFLQEWKNNLMMSDLVLDEDKISNNAIETHDLFCLDNGEFQDIFWAENHEEDILNQFSPGSIASLNSSVTPPSSSAPILSDGISIRSEPVLNSSASINSAPISLNDLAQIDSVISEKAKEYFKVTSNIKKTQHFLTYPPTEVVSHPQPIDDRCHCKKCDDNLLLLKNNDQDLSIFPSFRIYLELLKTQMKECIAKKETCFKPEGQIFQNGDEYAYKSTSGNLNLPLKKRHSFKIKEIAPEFDKTEILAKKSKIEKPHEAINNKNQDDSKIKSLESVSMSCIDSSKKSEEINKCSAVKKNLVIKPMKIKRINGQYYVVPHSSNKFHTNSDRSNIPESTIPTKARGKHMQMCFKHNNKQNIKSKNRPKIKDTLRRF